MASISDQFFWVSLAGLFLLTLRGFRKPRHVKQAFFYIAVLVACGGTYSSLFESGLHVRPKGIQAHEWTFLALLYTSMVLGMLAQYLHDRFTEPQRKRQAFDLGNFVAPIFASPVVFIPLLSAFQNAEVDLVNLSAPKPAIFLVAFENGFFWKAFFDKRRREPRL